MSSNQCEVKHYIGQDWLKPDTFIPKKLLLAFLNSKYSSMTWFEKNTQTWLNKNVFITENLKLDSFSKTWAPRPLPICFIGWTWSLTMFGKVGKYHSTIWTPFESKIRFRMTTQTLPLPQVCIIINKSAPYSA